MRHLLASSVQSYLLAVALALTAHQNQTGLPVR